MIPLIVIAVIVLILWRFNIWKPKIESKTFSPDGHYVLNKRVGRNRVQRRLMKMFLIEAYELKCLRCEYRRTNDEPGYLMETAAYNHDRDHARMPTWNDLPPEKGM